MANVAPIFAGICPLRGVGSGGVPGLVAGAALRLALDGRTDGVVTADGCSFLLGFEVERIEVALRVQTVVVVAHADTIPGIGQ